MSDIICPNPDCLEAIDCNDPMLDCGQYDDQETLIHCPVCKAVILITTHIEYSATLINLPKSEQGK